MVSLFGLSYRNWCVGCVLLSHFGLICTFLITIDIDSFPMLICHLCIFYGNGPIQSFVLFKIFGYFVFL